LRYKRNILGARARHAIITARRYFRRERRSDRTAIVKGSTTCRFVPPRLRVTALLPILLARHWRQYSPATFFLYSSGLWRYIAAASPFRGSIGLGYVNNWGRKDSKIFDKSETRNRTSSSMIVYDSSAAGGEDLIVFGFSLKHRQMPILRLYVDRDQMCLSVCHRETLINSCSDITIAASTFILSTFAHCTSARLRIRDTVDKRIATDYKTRIPEAMMPRQIFQSSSTFYNSNGRAASGSGSR